MSFTLAELQQFVDIAGVALMEEDVYLAGCFERRRSVLNDTQPPGILWLNNERYYQFLALRRLLIHFPKPIAIERDRFDFVVYPNELAQERGYDAVGEMKRWMSETGKDELGDIRTDIKKIVRRRLPGFLVLLSANPQESTENNLAFLAEELDQPKESFTRPFVFQTRGGPKTEQGWSKCEVFVVGLFVAAVSSDTDAAPWLHKRNRQKVANRGTGRKPVAGIGRVGTAFTQMATVL